MSGDALRKVKSGDPLCIPAGAYNAFVDAAVDLRQRQHNENRDPQRLRRDGDVILLLNSTASTVNRFGVLAITDPIILPADALELERVAFTGVVPAAEHTGKFAILLETAAPGAIARAAMGGVVPVKVGLLDPNHEFADIAAGMTDRLESGDSGAAQILWVETSISPVRQAFVRLPSIAGVSCLGDCLEFDENGCPAFDLDTASQVVATVVTGGSLSIVAGTSKKLRLTLTRATVTFNRNACGVLVGVSSSGASSVTSDLNLDECP